MTPGKSREVSVTLPWDADRQAVAVSIAMVELGAVDVRIEKRAVGDTSFQWRVSGWSPGEAGPE
jgi:hypothetical protein